MKTIVLFLLAFLATVSSFNEDDVTVGQLPPGAADDVVMMLTEAPMVQYISACPDVESDQIELLLFKKNNKRATHIDLANPVDVDPSKQVILVIHGWIAGAEAYGIPEVRDAYLKRYDANVIVVNWRKIAWQTYSTSVCQLPKVGAIVADFLCTLNQKFNVPMNNIHLVGHSLGGQMSGFIGQYTQSKCSQTVGRITGLDPAGPLFQGLPTNRRLDATDAEFVDVIHSNEGQFGYHGNCGDMDFHVNCGVFQKGCPITGVSLKEIMNLPVSIVACSHLRSLDYMAESVNSNRFQANVCKNCPLLCIPDLVERTRITMGEDCPRNMKETGYLTVTNRKAPFGRG